MDTHPLANPDTCNILHLIPINVISISRLPSWRYRFSQHFHRLVRGYPKLSYEIGRDPEMAIFRRFGALNAQNLLYLQADITLLEQELREQEMDDAADNPIDIISADIETSTDGSTKLDKNAVKSSVYLQAPTKAIVYMGLHSSGKAHNGVMVSWLLRATVDAGKRPVVWAFWV